MPSNDEEHISMNESSSSLAVADDSILQEEEEVEKNASVDAGAGDGMEEEDKKDKEVKKGRFRVYVANLSSNLTEAHVNRFSCFLTHFYLWNHPLFTYGMNKLKEIFEAYGDVTEVIIPVVPSKD